MTRNHFFGLISAFTLFSANAIAAEKSFDGVTCKTNVSSALIGRHMPNERVVTTAARHKDIRLKNIGAYGMENEGDPWTLISWQICGREYLVLERRGIVRDVLASPMPLGSPESQIASCAVYGLRLHGTAVAFISANDNKWPMLVKYAWLINDDTLKFSRIEGKEIVCTP